MPIFGYNVIGVNQLGLSDTDHFGNFNVARIALRGNPVPGGNMVSGHVYLSPPVGGPISTVQIGVYDATGGVPALFPLIATSIPLGVIAGSPMQWYVLSLLGPLTPGSSYVAAVLSNNADPANVSVKNDVIPNEDSMRMFTVPGVFNNPLGAASMSTREWSLYVTYVLPSDDDVSQYTGALSCDCDNSS